MTGCNTDWSAWNVGSRTQWEPVKGLIMGIDVIYNKQNTSSPNFAGIAPGAGVGLPVARPVRARMRRPLASSVPVPCYRAADQDAWTGTFRIQRDFLP